MFWTYVIGMTSGSSTIWVLWQSDPAIPPHVRSSVAQGLGHQVDTQTWNGHVSSEYYANYVLTSLIQCSFHLFQCLDTLEWVKQAVDSDDLGSSSGHPDCTFPRPGVLNKWPSIFPHQLTSRIPPFRPHKARCTLWQPRACHS